MERYKFPRTSHLPFSPGYSGDDERLVDLKHFEGKQMIVTEKLDGENTTIYSDGFIHARSMDGTTNPWMDWVKNFMADKFYKIPTGWRIMGENMFAIHSIEYTNLRSFFYMFGCADENNVIQSWGTTEELAWELGIETPDLIWEGIFYNPTLENLGKIVSLGVKNMEGFVLRNIDSFPASEYQNNVAKYVRAGHVQTDEHWTHNWKPSKLMEN